MVNMHKIFDGRRLQTASQLGVTNFMTSDYRQQHI